jgi:hypothetical protein
MKQRIHPRGTYSRGAGNRPRTSEGRGDGWYSTGPKRPPPRTEVPDGAVGVESWGVLPAKPPRRAR